MRRARLAILAAFGLLTVTLGAACSSSGSTAGPSGTTSAIAVGSTTVPTGAANPNTSEVNPAGDIPDEQVFVTYAPPSGLFRVDVPEGWARTEDNGAVTFADTLNSIRLETVPADSAPTLASVKANEVGAIESAATNYEAGTIESVSRRSGDAVRITYRADSRPDPVTGKVIRLDVERYEFFKNGTEAILTLSGPQGADNVDPWRIVTDSFVWA